MTNTFYMLVGLPGSGKSCLARELLAEHKKNGRPTVWLSSDAIREKLYGAEEIQGDSAAVFAEMKKRTDEALRAGNDVIFDACNINSKRRRAFLGTLTYFTGPKICIVCATPYNVCLARNAHRARIVPEDVIRRMYRSWNPPFFFEGWDEIELRYSDGSKNSFGAPEDFKNRTMSFDHENPHHAETLGQHISDTYQYVLAHSGTEPDSNLAVAALLHDCGKPFTKTYVNSKGETTEVAHYYQHACVGAYDAMFYDHRGKCDSDVLEICTLVDLHMNPFAWETEATVEKQRGLLGTDFVDALALLHEADEASSIQR